MIPQSTNRLILTALVIALLVGGGYYLLTRPDQRTGAQHIGDAIGELPNGVDKAARELKDRTPADKIHDAVKDETKK
jgi:hypothetical protein